MSGTAPSADETAIRGLIADREAAMRSKDADAAVADYVPDVVAFTLAPPLLHSGSEVTDASRQRAWFAGFGGPFHYDVTELSVTAGSDVAFAHSLNRLAAAPQGTPDSFELWFRSTVCLTKVDGRWRIAHEHDSTPFYMDGSSRAALDLQP